MASIESPKARQGTWTAQEHERFLAAIIRYPQGPWRQITEHVGTRSVKQVQTHGQKYRDKVRRHHCGLLKTTMYSYELGHRVDESTQTQFTSDYIIRRSPSKRRRRCRTRSKQVKSEDIGDDTRLDADMDAIGQATPNEMTQSALSTATTEPTEYTRDDAELPIGVEPIPFPHRPGQQDELDVPTLLEALDLLLVE